MLLEVSYWQDIGGSHRDLLVGFSEGVSAGKDCLVDMTL